MPDRIIRDELLRSRRYWECSPEARCLFVAIVLSADDSARYSADPFTLVLCMGSTVTQARAAELLAELAAADLVRTYKAAGNDFLFVPRFRQRKRYTKNSAYPAPPNTINDDPIESQPTAIPEPSRSHPKDPEVGVGVGVGVGVKRGDIGEVLGLGRGEEGRGASVTPALSNEEARAMLAQVKTALEKSPPVKPIEPLPKDEPTLEQIAARESERTRQIKATAQAIKASEAASQPNPFPPGGAATRMAMLTEGIKPQPPAMPGMPNGPPNGSGQPWHKTDDGIMRKARELNLTPTKGETYAQIKRRIFDLISAHKA